MKKKCICIKSWKDYNIGDKTSYNAGITNTYLGGYIVSEIEFENCLKEYFKKIPSKN